MLNKVKEFIKVAKKEKLPIEAILLSNVDKVLIEHHFVEKKKRNIYSHSKSFVSAMIGVALLEKKITLQDRLVDYMKDELSEEDYKRLYDIKVEDLLTMKSGFGQSILMSNERIKGIPNGFTSYVLSHSLKYEPGTHFHYSNGDTFLLTKVIEGAYKTNFYTLTNNKLFKPLRINSPAWEIDMYGNCLGASGLRLDIKDMNKLGRLFLNSGKWHGKQLIDPDYVKECRKLKVNLPEDTWLGYGYTYQFWKVRYYDSYRADGAFGQITFIIDDLGEALSIQCPEDGNLALVLEKIKQYIFD